MFLFACTVLFVVVYLAEVRSTLVDCQFPVQPMDVLEMVEFQDTGLQGGGGRSGINIGCIDKKN